VVNSEWFPRLVVAFFLVQALVSLLVTATVTALVTGFVLPSDPTSTSGARHLIRQADLAFAAGAAALIFLGAALILRSRMLAYRLFKLAMLVSIFLTQIFAFYDIQFAALYGLAFNVVGLVCANALIARERERLTLQGLSDRQQVTRDSALSLRAPARTRTSGDTAGDRVRPGS
jgi:hypothetical protein